MAVLGHHSYVHNFRVFKQRYQPYNLWSNERQFRVAFTKSLGLNCLLSRNPTRLRTISIMTKNRDFIAEEENAEVVGKKLQSTATTSSETTHGRSVGSVKVRGNFPLRKRSVPFVTVNAISNSSLLSFSWGRQSLDCGNSAKIGKA